MIMLHERGANEQECKRNERGVWTDTLFSSIRISLFSTFVTVETGHNRELLMNISNFIVVGKAICTQY